MTSSELIHRRSFVRGLTGAAFGFSAARALTDLRLIQSAIAQSSGGGIFPDYKALVCLFLGGGNDGGNMVIPFTPEEYTAYTAARTNMALADSLANVTAAQPYYIRPLSTANTGGRPFGVHSNCDELRDLFDTGKLAFLANAGTLVEPINKTQYTNRTRRRPPQLFSHNDQVVQWQTSIPDQISPTGWGGRVADVLRDSVFSGAGNRLSMSISAAGFNTWQVGRHEHLYQVSAAPAGTSTAGARTLRNFGTYAARSNKIREIIAQGESAPNLFHKDYAGIFDSAVDAADTLNTALGGISAGDNTTLNTIFDPLLAGTELAQTRSAAGQLKMIAKMVAARNTIGIKRQIFFCSLGGFDTHGGQIASHASLMRAVSKNVKAFYDCMNAFGLSNSVTLFTQSDFGRTGASNGAGSDHAWGNNTLMCGGAVQGGRVFGTTPNYTIGGPEDVGRGSYIPTTSVDEYAATIARWFGVSESNLDIILPNLHRFPSRNLGFMA